MAGKSPTRRAAEPTLDARLARLERGLHGRLSPEVRRRVLRNMEWIDHAWAKARRECHVPDQTEPGLVFRPTPAVPQRRHSRNG